MENKEYNFLLPLLFYLALSFSIIVKISFIYRPFIGHYDVDGILYYLLSSSFIKYGAINLGFIPVINSGPLTTPPDYYAHWPLLYPHFLAILFRLFGENIFIGRLLSIVISTASSLIFFKLVATLYNRRLAYFCGFIYCLSAINIYYGFWVGRTYFSLFFWLLGSLYFVLYINNGNFKDLLFLCFSFGMAGLISWEPTVLIIYFVLLIILIRDVKIKKAAILACSSFIIAFLIHHILIAIADTNLLNDQFLSALGRASLTYDKFPQRPFFNWIFLFAWNMYISFGVIVLFCSLIGFYYFFKNRLITIHLGIIISVPLLWFIFMSRQAFDHDYEYLFWAPIIAITTGYFLNRLFLKSNYYYILLIVIIISLILEVYPNFNRFVKPKNYNDMTYLPILSEKLKETDIIVQMGWGPGIAFYTKRHVIQINCLSEFQDWKFKRIPKWATGVYYIGGYEKIGNKNIDNGPQNDKHLLIFFKKVFKKIYKPLDRQGGEELVKYVKDNFPRKNVNSSIIIYDLSSILKR